MPDNARPYEKLGRSTRKNLGWIAGTVVRASLYAGSDHLLLAEREYYKERYRRFYYRDIQAFVLRKTNAYAIGNVAWTTVMLAFFGLGLATGDTVGFIILGGIAGLCGIFLAANLIQGPSCRFYLKTAVQFEELPPLNRERAARKAMTLLRERIARHQAATPQGSTPATPSAASAEGAVP